ncbi:MAG: chromate efflux transporter [Opitutaceae bacterium]|jgi:chromate transporter
MEQLSRLSEIAGAFLKLGLISFGGPVAHLGYLHREFVTKRRWLEDESFSDIVALCQFLPGPSSSQAVFALGMRRAGLAGGLIASLCFALPSTILMILFAYGVASLGDLRAAGWLHGLKVAAVAVVAQAVWSMGRKLCPDWIRAALALAAAAWVLLFPGSLGQIVAMAAGTALGWVIFHRDIQSFTADGPRGLTRGHTWAIATLVLFALILVLLPIVAAASGEKSLFLFDSFYRAGALVFGGGHVILPLLRAELVPANWINDNAFLAGYGAAQALPGPLFTFSAYLGTVMSSGPLAWLGGLWCLSAIFLPGWLLIGGTLPFWDSFRGTPWAQAALRGANAAVVGVLLAAFYNPVLTQGIRNWRDIVAALAALALLERWRTPPWLVVLLAAAAGQWILG